MVVTSATGFPSSYPFDAHIEAEGSNTDEIVSVTSLSSGTTYNVTRASEDYAGSSSASAHASGANVRLVVSAGALAVFGAAGVEFTDGTNDVTGATKLTVSGATVGGSTPNATLTVSAGALVLLEQHTASSSATLDFTTCITSTYDEYVIEMWHRTCYQRRHMSDC